MKLQPLFLTFLFPLSAMSAPRIVNCEGLDGSQVQKISVRLAGNRIVPFSTKRLIRIVQGNALLNFSLNLADEPYEWSKSFIASNGYGILEIGSTADREQIGVHAASGKGFYKYSDLGSGSGNRVLNLRCD